MKRTTVGVVGGGVVGSAIARAYAGHVHGVRVWDLLDNRRTHCLRDVLNCDFIFICLPEDQVHKFFDDLFPEQLRSCYILKSTVPIGTTKQLTVSHQLPGLLHCPEFLTARCADLDAQNPSRIVIGLPQPNLHNPYLECFIQLQNARFPHVPVHLLTSDESEAVKLIQNAFFAVKVAFWNEARSLTDRLNLSWQAVLSAILSDGRIHPSHTQVPGHDGSMGFGGACLPKDAGQFLAHLEETGLRGSVTRAALLRNVYDRRGCP